MNATLSLQNEAVEEGGRHVRALTLLAERTAGYSGSDLKELCRYAVMQPVREQLQRQRARDLAGFIGVAGTYDFIPFDEPEFYDMFGRTPDEQARSQPINFVDGDEPPALLLQGEKDTIVYPSEAISLEGRYVAQGEPVELKLYPTLGHEKLLLAFGPLKNKAPVLADTMAFIRRYSGAASH